MENSKTAAKTTTTKVKEFDNTKKVYKHRNSIESIKKSQSP